MIVTDPRPAIAKVTASPSPLYPGDSVTLTADIGGRSPLTLAWTLPGNVTSSTNPVTFKIPSTATFRISVSLVASNSSGATRHTISLPVLNPRPRGTLRLEPATPYLGDSLTASVDATGRPPFTYRWTILPDGISSSSPTLVWDSSAAPAGPRRIELSLTNASGTTKLIRSLRIDPPPLAVSYAPVCPNLCFFNLGQPVSFILAIHPKAPAPTRFEYDWNGDGLFEASSPDPITSYAYPKSGSFRPRVRLTAGGRTQTLLSTRILIVSKPR